jgi:YD repeat-containing protein
MSEFYTLYSFTASIADLSALFQTPGMADSSYQNVSWQMSETTNGDTAPNWSGNVGADGTIIPGDDTPGDFIFIDSQPDCPTTWQVQVQFTPDPCQPCTPCQCQQDPSRQKCCPASPTSSDPNDLGTGYSDEIAGGNSVELATGRFVFQKELLSLSAPGSGSWSFGLNYKSNYDVESILGKNFAFPQYMHLKGLALIGGGDDDPWTTVDIQLVTNQLTRAIFEQNSETGLYSASVGNNTGAILTIESFLDAFILTSSDGTTTKFFDSGPTFGQIQSIVDRNGNSQTMEWGSSADGTLQLLSVTDAYGRKVTYSYYGAEANYRLQQLTDFLGRQLNFQYDGDDHLVAVVTPSILKAAPGNTFPGGTAYVFQYDVGNANPARRDDLIKIWYPNQTLPYLNVETRDVDVEAVYENATPRYQITYGQSINDIDSYGKVLTETLGDPENEVGGTATFAYTTCSDDLPTNIIDSDSPIVNRTIYTDRNGNRKIYDFNAYWTVSRLEVDLNRYKTGSNAEYVTWTKFNAQNQPLVIVYPEGNSTEYIYDTGIVDSGDPLLNPYIPRRGLLLSESRLPGNSIGVPSRSGSGGQAVLTKSYFYDPLFNQLCATIDERGNPIDGAYFTPQNLGTTPTDTDRSRYATLYTFDYQKDSSDTVTGDTTLQHLLGLTSSEIGSLITYVNGQMTATDGTGGIPAGFQMDLGDINGDGTGSGASSGLPNATHLGNLVQTTYPSVLLVGGTTQSRVELFTVNLRGQVTTATDPEGNLTITARYPENDPEGTGQNISTTLGTQQYGLVRETRRDADPDDVMSLVGASGDLVAFVPNIITRTNTPGIYQDLTTRYEGSSGCMTCAYDPMGNVLNETDPRGFTTVYDRNEMGEIYRVTSPTPYNFKVETSYDSNRNVIQVDTEDWQVAYNSPDPSAAGFGTFTPSGGGTTAHVPMVPGPGGALRSGWFSNLMAYDILDDRIEDDIDATGSTPANLVTTYAYDANQNLTKITKPEGNTVEFDYDERNLKIAQRVGYVSTSQLGAVTGYTYDGNKNLLIVIGPGAHTGTVPGFLMANPFGGGGSMLSIVGDGTVQNTYDGFDRVIVATDGVGGTIDFTFDPVSNIIGKQTAGTTAGGGGGVLANVTLLYDEASHLYEQQQDVFIPAGYTLSSGRAVTHTGGGLASNSLANDHTGTATLTSGDTSYVLTRTIYDRSGRAVTTLTDNTAQTTYAYDGAGRQILATDPLNNTTATQYDGNSNPVQTTRTDVCTITSPTVPNEVFISFTWFDSLNRPIVSGTQGADGNLTADLGLCCPWQGLPTTLFSLIGCDSRGNRLTVTDPKSNVVVSVFDGASRLIETQQEMRQNGDGRNGPYANKTFLTPSAGIIRTEYIYDGNSRLAELVDDRGASTVYVYDSLDRKITKTFADGTIFTWQYDASSCVIVTTDGVHETDYYYDSLLRVYYFEVGPRVQAYQYDGFSRITQGLNALGYLMFVEFDFVYDSLGRVIEETQSYNGNIAYTTHTIFVSWPATQVAYPAATYPTPDVTITNGYDALYRRNSVTGASAGSGTLDSVGWQFFGPNRVVETNYGSGSLIVTQMNNARSHSAVQPAVPLPAWGDDSSDQLGYDGSGRMIAKRYLTGGINGSSYAYNDATSLVGFTTSFDRASNKLYERHLHAEERSHLYQPFNTDGSLAVGYDSANRLRQYQRGTLSSAIIPYRVPAGASVATPITLPDADQVRTYGLDGLGNWKTTNFTEVGSGGGTTSTAEVRQHNYVNEITSVQDTTGGTPTTNAFTYLKNGLLSNDGARAYQYDLFNRLVQVSDASTSTVLATYIYDAMNRRIQKTIVDLGTGFGGLTGDIPAGTTDYLYDGQQIIELCNDATPGVWTQVNFWGQYMDELLFFTLP